LRIHSSLPANVWRQQVKKSQSFIIAARESTHVHEYILF
jgi:hypothetical protein